MNSEPAFATVARAGNGALMDPLPLNHWTR